MALLANWSIFVVLSTCGKSNNGIHALSAIARSDKGINGEVKAFLEDHCTYLNLLNNGFSILSYFTEENFKFKIVRWESKSRHYQDSCKDFPASLVFNTLRQVFHRIIANNENKQPETILFAEFCSIFRNTVTKCKISSKIKTFLSQVDILNLLESSSKNFCYRVIKKQTTAGILTEVKKY